MAIKYLTEPLNNGIVSARDPFYLTPGEFSAGQYCYFTVADDVIRKVPAIATAVASASACSGLQHICFTDSEMLLTHGAGAYYKAPITSAGGALGAITAVVTGLTVTSIPDTFTAVQHNNKYVLLDGINTPQVLRSDSSVRRLGLQPVIAVALAASATANANTWPGRTVGYFDYWYTEVAEYGTSPEDIVIESAYEATVSSEAAGAAATVVSNVTTTNGRPIKIAVATVNVTTLATKVNVDLPLAPRNTSATHYYVYRSLAKDFEAEPSFPTGEKVARVAIPTSESDPSIVNGRIRVVDGAVTQSGPFYPATYVSNTVSTGVTWTNPERLASDDASEYGDASYARMTVAVSGGSLSPIPANQIIVSSLSATGISDPVSQMRVLMRAKLAGGFTTSGVYLNVRISGNAGSSWSAAVPITLTATAVTEVSTPWSNFGNPYLSTTDIANANLRLRVDVSGYKPGAGAGEGYVDLDGMRVEIRHNGTAPIAIGAYPGIVIQAGQDKFVTSKGGEPPVSSIGCIFQGSLVTNDVSKKNMVRWSMPGEIDAFPALYFFPISPPRGSSEVTFIGVVNNVCIVGLKNSVVRVNYLPSENDSSFTRDRIYDFITTDVGIFNQNAACVYRNADGREVLAIITQDGIYVTDGFSIHKVSSDYNFAAIVAAFTAAGVSMFAANKLTLVSESQSQNLILMYNYANAASLNMFNFSTKHTKEGGQLKVGGVWPTAVDYKAIVTVKTLTGYPIVYLLNAAYAIHRIKPLHEDGAVNAALSLTSRRIAVRTPPSEFELKQIYLYGDTLTGAYITANMYRSEKAVGGTITSSTTSASSVIGKVDIKGSGEFAVLNILGPASTSATEIGHIVVEYDDQINTESM